VFEPILVSGCLLSAVSKVKPSEFREAILFGGEDLIGVELVQFVIPKVKAPR
jgi:hypothetical protein